MVTSEQIAVLARLGVTGSVQPAFDAAWGGPGELYQQRLGGRPGPADEPAGDWQQAGGVMAYGTDAPVTALAGWAMVADARPAPATRSAGRLRRSARRRRPAAGTWPPETRMRDWIAPGQRADLVIWDTDGLGPDGLPDLAGGAPLPSALRCWWPAGPCWTVCPTEPKTRAFPWPTPALVGSFRTDLLVRVRRAALEVYAHPDQALARNLTGPVGDGTGDVDLGRCYGDPVGSSTTTPASRATRIALTRSRTSSLR